MSETINVTLRENRKFAPPAEFAAKAQLQKAAYDEQMKLGLSNPEEYWADAAKELTWDQPWSKVLEWDAPIARWFVGGKLNVSRNCLDRHQAKQANKPALIWEGEPGEVARWTYAELLDQTQRFTAVYVSWAQGGRPRFDLHADDSRGRRRDARVHARWISAYRDFRRLQL